LNVVALHQLISFGSGFGAVLPRLGVLLAFVAAANSLACSCANKAVTNRAHRGWPIIN
jgi:hypothetical protein